MLHHRPVSLLACALLVFGSFAVNTSVAANSPGSAPLPNIVIIVSDDQAWTDYGFMGHPHIQTPNIDRLAAESLTFTRGYVPSSLCCPSLASLITGLYPHQHKITSNDPPLPPKVTQSEFVRTQAFGEGREVMNRHLEAVPTLPRLLTQAGYMSLQTGKWWQGNFSRGGFTHGMTNGDRHGDEGLEIGRKTLQPIYDFIATAQREQRPFFVWYAPMLPHTPHNPPPRLLEKYQPHTQSLPIARYWAMVEWFDETVGELLNHLGDAELAENTIVVFLADNGWITNPKTGEFAAKSKTSPYDGGVRTPIMIRWNGHIAPRRSEQLATSIDIVPTLLATAKLEAMPEMTGVNLLDEKEVAARSAISGECFTHNSLDLDRPAASLRWRWIVDGDWKLIVPDAKNQPNDAAELYDLEHDPIEEHNLAASQAAKVEAMREKLDAWWPGK